MSKILYKPTPDIDAAFQTKGITKTTVTETGGFHDSTFYPLDKEYSFMAVKVFNSSTVNLNVVGRLVFYLAPNKESAFLFSDDITARDSSGKPKGVVLVRIPRKATHFRYSIPTLELDVKISYVHKAPWEIDSFINSNKKEGDGTYSYVHEGELSVFSLAKNADRIEIPIVYGDFKQTKHLTLFSYIKNKPTQLSQFIDNIGVGSHIANKANPHAVTTAQIGAVDLTTNQSIGGVKSFTNAVKISGSIKGTNTYLQFLNNGTPMGIIGSDASVYGGDAGNLSVYVYGDKSIEFSTNSSKRLIITGSGWVGIGTTNPLYKLDVSGTGRFTDNVTAPTFIGALSGNASTATTATKLGTSTVGSTQLPFYLNAGTATAITQANLRVGLFGTTAIGSTQLPIYLAANGVPTAITQANLRIGLFGAAAIGSTTRPIYIAANGVPAAITGSIANSTTGSAATLTTTRAINGTNFNGSEAITTALWGTARTLSFTGDVTGSSSVNGSVNVATAMTLANVATAGTYKSVTINAKGLVTSGTNPTTLGGYGITDAATLSAFNTHVANKANPHNVTKAQVGLSSVDNLSMAQMFSYASLTEETSIQEAYIDYLSIPNGAYIKNWSFKQVGTELHFLFNSVVKVRMLSDGTFAAVGGITALST